MQLRVVAQHVDRGSIGTFAMLGRVAAVILIAVILASFIAILSWPSDSSHDPDYELYLDKVERGELPDSSEHARLSYPLVMMAP